MRVFNDWRVKTIGAFVLWGLVCFAVGNAHVTGSALEGSGRWWQQNEHQAIARHVAGDRKVAAAIRAQCPEIVMQQLKSRSEE